MLILRMLWRDWRGGEIGILFAAVIMAVAIVTGISLFADRINLGLNSQSRDFLAADRVLQSNRNVDEEILLQANSRGLDTAVTLTFPSMVYVGDNLQRAAVKAVSEQYPLRGTLQVSDQPFAQGEPIETVPAVGTVWVDSRLLPLLDVAIGEQLNIGEAKFQIKHILISEPDNSGNPMQFGPRIMMNLQDLEQTAAVGAGSRVNYRYLFAGDPLVLEQYEQWLKPRLDKTQQWIKVEDSQPRIAQALQRAERFLLLAGALGVGLSGIAIALAARRYTERHFDYVAILRTLGASGRRIMLLYSGNLLTVAIIGTVSGWLLGWLIQTGFVFILSDYIPIELPQVSGLEPLLTGLMTALICLFAFALPPLSSLLSVSPARVISRDIAAASVNSLLSFAVACAGFFLLIVWYGENLRLATGIFAGILLVAIIACTVAWLVLRGTRSIGMQAGGLWRLSISSLYRRGWNNVMLIVVFSIAIMLLLVLTVIRTAIIDEWRLQLPDDAPNYFLLNMSPAELADVRTLMAENQITLGDTYPIISARLTRINDVSLDNNAELDDRARIERPFNATWAAQLPSENQVVAGRWWNETDINEVSVEAELAARMGIQHNDLLSFSLGSEEIKVRVASIRSLNWDSLQPNFYMIFHPQLMQQYDASYIGSFYLKADQKLFLNQLIRQYPTLVLIEMDAIINQLRTIVLQVGRAIELVLGLILLSGVLVLSAALRASLDERFRESAILRTLGAGRKLILGSLVIEFLLLGVIAGILAAFSAEVSIYMLQVNLLNMDFMPHWWLWILGPVAGGSIVSLAGYFSCRQVVETPPIQVLRNL